MKKLLIWLLFLPTLIMADAVIFSGNDVKALKQNLDLFGIVKVMSGAVDPSAGGGVAAPVGSAYLSTVHGLFLKTGVGNTSWTKNALLPIDLTAQVTGVLPTANGGTGSSNLGTGIVKASSGALSTGTVDLASNVNGILPVANGGTSLSTVPTNGQLLIGNGTNYTLSGLTGTANQVSVTNGAGSITLSTPQDIATTSNVQFANLNATGTTTLNTSLTGPLKASSGVVSSSAIDLASEVTGTLPIANGGTGSTTQNFVDLTTNQTVAGDKTFSNTLKSDSIQTTGSSGVVIKNSSGTTVADFGPANTTNASIVGGLNVGGNVVATGTVTGSNLSGTNTGDTEIGNDTGNIGVAKEFDFPNSQVVQTDSTNKKFRIESGNNNELYNGGFEAETLAVGWTASNATSSANTANPLEGKKSLSLALTGALSLSQSSTINAAQKSGVQMVASVWVNSSDVSDLQLCSLKNGSEDKCTVSGGYVQGSGWRQLTVSFIGDATSNGLKLKSTDTTGTVLVDLAYVGIGSPIVDFTPDMVYTAEVKTTTGVVTKENIDFIASCTAANPSVCTFVGGIFTTAPNCTLGSDNWAHNITSVTATSFSLFSFNTTSAAAVANISAFVTCVKTGADYKTSKAYVASGSVALNTTIYSAKVSSTGVVSGENTDWINGNASISDTSLFTISFNSSVFTISPNCLVTPNTGTVSAISQIDGAASTSSVAVRTTNSPSTKTAYGFEITCQKQGTDYTTAFNPVIVGSFQGYNETPGTSRVEVFSFSYGATVGSVCTTGTCAYLGQVGGSGGVVSKVDHSTPGVYLATFKKTYSYLSCSFSGVGASGAAVAPYTDLNCTNCSTLPIRTVKTSTEGYVNSYGTLLCQGTPQ